MTFFTKMTLGVKTLTRMWTLIVNTQPQLRVYLIFMLQKA